MRTFRTAALAAALALPSAASAASFGAGPLVDVRREAARVVAAHRLTDVNAEEFAAIMMAPTYGESGAGPNGVPSPMALGRSDMAAALYAFGSTGTPYKRAYFHAGVGMWQLDSAGLGAGQFAAAQIDTSTAAPVVADSMARAWRTAKRGSTKAQKRARVWRPWYACRGSECETLFQELYDASSQTLSVREDVSVTSKGGLVWHKCSALNDTRNPFDCAEVNPNRAQGSRTFWSTAPLEGSSNKTPLTLPFVSFQRGRAEERHWPRGLTPYDRFISATRPLGQNARNALTWSKVQAICTWLRDCRDVAFVIDSTGSMWDDIASVRASAASLVDKLIDPPDEDGRVSDATRIAVVEYKDFPQSPYGDAGDFPYLARAAFTHEKATIVGALPAGAGGGNDWPESAMTALTRTLQADGLGEWREGELVERSIILMTDAPGHDPDPFTGASFASVAAQAQDVGVQTAAAGGTLLASTAVVTAAAGDAEATAGASPVHIQSVVIGFDSQALSQWTRMSHATGGEVFPAETASQVVDALAEAIGKVTSGDDGGDDGGGGEEPPPPPPPPPGNRAPDVSGAVASVKVLWPANHGLTTVDVLNVSDPDGDAVSIRVTAVTQDEPVRGTGAGASAPDALGVGATSAQLRAERAGDATDRVYRVEFTATDARGASSSGSVQVCVPHDLRPNTGCVDDGQLHDATVP